MSESTRPEPKFTIDNNQVFDVNQYSHEVIQRAEQLQRDYDQVNRQYLQARDRLLALDDVDRALMIGLRKQNQLAESVDYQVDLENPDLSAAVRAPLNHELVLEVLNLRLKRFDIRTQQLQMEGSHKEARSDYREKLRANLDYALAQAMGNRSHPADNSNQPNYLRQEITSITAEAGNELDIVHDRDMKHTLHLSGWDKIKIRVFEGKSALKEKQESIAQEIRRVSIQHECRKQRLTYIQNLPAPY